MVKSYVQFYRSRNCILGTLKILTQGCTGESGGAGIQPATDWPYLTAKYMPKDRGTDLVL